MTNRDQHRHPAGTPIGGRYAPGLRRDADVTLDGAGEDDVADLLEELKPGGGRLGRARHVPGRDALAADGPAAELDHLVGATMDASALTNGVVGRTQRENLRTWHRWAASSSQPERQCFARGLGVAVLALTTEAMTDQDAVAATMSQWVGADDARTGQVRPTRLDEALDALGVKRTTAVSRQRWMEYGQLAPTIHDQRGYFAAAAILSGTDDQWGLRDDPAATVTG